MIEESSHEDDNGHERRLITQMIQMIKEGQ